MRELSLDRLRTLVCIADLGSFAAAAKALHLAPPTVTLHIAELESRLGARLLVRAPAGATPTGIGASLIVRARRLLADAEDAVEQVRREADGRSGRVRLGASTGALVHLLPQALARLKREQPGIDVQVAVLTSAESMARLAAGSLDIGLVALPQASVTGVQLTAWRRDPVMAVLPAHWRAPARITPSWLAARPLILNDASTRLSRLTSAWFAAAGEMPRPRIELNFNDAIRSLVAAGYGGSLLPREGEGEDETPDPRISVRPLRPGLWRELGVAHRIGGDEGATAVVLRALAPWRQR